MRQNMMHLLQFHCVFSSKEFSNAQCLLVCLLLILYIVANVSAQCSYAEPQNILDFVLCGKKLVTVS